MSKRPLPAAVLLGSAAGGLAWLLLGGVAGPDSAGFDSAGSAAQPSGGAVAASSGGRPAATAPVPPSVVPAPGMSSGRPAPSAGPADGSSSATVRPGPSRPVLQGSFAGAASAQPTGRPAAAVRPVRIRIPSIAVDAPLERLRLGPDRVLQPPQRWESAGWYANGPVPGEQGPAVLAGHVDSTSGPAVFFRLRELDPGERVEVALSDGRTARFRVVDTDQFAKADFPTEDVYGPTPSRELRLITCGGAFDSAWGHYRDNVVVSAVSEEEAQLALG